MGTVTGLPLARFGPTATPMPRSSSQRITPPAASRPKALPPASRMAWTFSTALIGASSSVSRVPGAAPRTSTPQTAPPSASTTVQPVGRRASVKWPTESPATAVRPKDIKPSVRTTRSGKHAGSVLHPRRDLAEMEHRVAEAHLDHGQALEIVAGRVLVGDADAAVQLDALLTDESHRLPELHLGLRQRAPSRRRRLAE